MSPSHHLLTHKDLPPQHILEFPEDNYEHVNESAMGSALITLIANIYMEGFKEEAYDITADQLSLWLHGYVTWITPLPLNHALGPDNTIYIFHSHALIKIIASKSVFIFTIKKRRTIIYQTWMCW